MTRYLFPVCLALLVAAGCSKTEPAGQAAPSASAAAAAVPGPEPKTALADDAIPTEEDFESEAEQGINAANLEASLDQLDREITAP